MTPAELKARIDAALEAEPDVMLLPNHSPDQAIECNCPLGVLYGEPWPSAVEIDPDVRLTTPWPHDAFAYGFDHGERPTTNGYSKRACDEHPGFFDLGVAYRSHPRCILTQGGGSNV